MYLTYDEYCGLGGKLSEEQYLDYGYRAQDLLDRYSFNRLQLLDTIPEKVKRVLKRLTDAVEQSENNPRVRSESNDGVSVTYADEKSADARYSDIISDLADIVTADGVSLLYRGVGE